MKCIHCNSTKLIRFGKSKNNVQLFKCCNCSRRFRESYRNKSWIITNQTIINYVKEGLGIRSIARLLNISPSTVISRIKTISKSMKKPFPVFFGLKIYLSNMNSIQIYNLNIYSIENSQLKHQFNPKFTT